MHAYTHTHTYIYICRPPTFAVPGVGVQRHFTAGHCFWEKAKNGCNEGEDFELNAYNLYALCREGKQDDAQFQCTGKPAELNAGQCTSRTSMNLPKHTRSLTRARTHTQSYHYHHHRHTVPSHSP